MDRIALCVIGSLVSLVLMAVGCVALVGRDSTRVVAEASLEWPETEGTITRSWVQDSHGTGGNLHRGKEGRSARVRYRYRVNGKDYEGGRVSFFAVESAEATVKRYPKGNVVAVYYDPADPKTSTLQTGAEGAAGKPLIVPVILLLVGTGLLIGTLLLIFFSFRKKPAGANPVFK
jgi:hypothetical protein